MINLPAQRKKLHVALVYNQKKEDVTNQSLTEDSENPSRSTGKFYPHVSNFFSENKNYNQAVDLYAEWDTFETIDAVKIALEEHHNVSLVEADQDAYLKLKQLQPDIVFNIAEGLNGVSREAQIPAMLEMLNIPYTGSDPLTLAICLDKSRAKEIMSYHKIPTPEFWVISRKKELRDITPILPAIVKPLHEGSSKGIFNTSIVRDRAGLEREVNNVLSRYNEPVLIEEYLPGREFTVAILGNEDDLTVLPIVEIMFETLPPDVNPIYSYEAKWIWDRAENPLEIFSCPAKLTEQLKTQIEQTCRRAYKVLRCRDWCRIDVRLDKDGKPNIIELNPLPGILPNPQDNSCFPKAARAAGLNYNQLIQTVLLLAAQRTGILTDFYSLPKISSGVNL